MEKRTIKKEKNLTFIKTLKPKLMGVGALVFASAGLCLLIGIVIELMERN